MLTTRGYATLVWATTPTRVCTRLASGAARVRRKRPTASVKQKPKGSITVRKRASPKQAVEEVAKSNLSPIEKLLARQVELDRLVKRAPRKPREKKDVKTGQLDAAKSPKSKTLGRPKKSGVHIPPRLLAQTSDNHSDLASFLAYAKRTKLKTTTNVYKGTHYEYTVVEALKALNFYLRRTGRSNDLGIDLVGHWTLPESVNEIGLRVLVQCKATKPTPAMVRELEGAYVGAPAGWRGDGVLALLVSVKESTKGVRDGLQRSRWPMGVLQIDREGNVRQFVWNAEAAEIGLAGLGVTMRYDGSTINPDSEHKGKGKGKKAEGTVGLTWLGKPWLGAGSGEAKAGANASPGD